MLSIASLTHVYPNGTRALDDVSLEIPPGLYGLRSEEHTSELQSQ